MSIEPWKVMLGMSAFLVLFGVLTTIGPMSTASHGQTIVTVALVIVTSYIGFRIGRRFSTE